MRIQGITPQQSAQLERPLQEIGAILGLVNFEISWPINQRRLRIEVNLDREQPNEIAAEPRT